MVRINKPAMEIEAENVTYILKETKTFPLNLLIDKYMVFTLPFSFFLPLRRFLTLLAVGGGQHMFSLLL